MQQYSKKHLLPMSETELDTIKGLLLVSNNRISQNQKNALLHLLVQHRIMSNDKMQRELVEMKGIEK